MSTSDWKLVNESLKTGLLVTTFVAVIMGFFVMKGWVDDIREDIAGLASNSVAMTEGTSQNAVYVNTAKCPKSAVELAKLTETSPADWKQSDALS